MYQLQILYNKTGNWENSVYQPMEFNRVQALLKSIRSQYGNVHSYRVIPSGQQQEPDEWSFD